MKMSEYVSRFVTFCGDLRFTKKRDTFSIPEKNDNYEAKIILSIKQYPNCEENHMEGRNVIRNSPFYQRAQNALRSR